MLRLADPRFGEEAVAAIAEVLASGQLTQGPVVTDFERAVADHCGARHGVAVTSATTALELSLAALDIGPGDEVAVADFTYPATGNAVLQRGAEVRLVEVDPSTYCVDPRALAAALGPDTKAVLTVDVFGLPADYGAIEPLLAERGVPLICDAACSLGGAIGDRPVGSFGLASCFSFHPRKSLTTGEGGMVVTDDDVLAERLRLLRNHGSRRSGWRARFVEPGFNYRLSELNAALGLVQVPDHAATVARRGELAALLSERLRELPGVRPQAVPDGHRHPYQAYVVVLEDDALDRDALIAALRDEGVESTLGTYALHAEPAFAERCDTEPGDLPHSYRLAERTLTLPLHQNLSDDDVATIAGALEAAMASLAGTS
jgi:dTDP-4-amino-4,6-dideoxygalactose transaminase